MNHAPTESPASLFAPCAAVRVGSALIVALAAVLVLRVLDDRGRADLESFEEVTAVGDRAFYKIPESMPPPADVPVVFRGQTLFPVYKRITDKDSGMIRAGEDDSKTYRLYTERQTGKSGASGTDEKAGPALFVKIGLDEYFEVRARK